MRGRGRSPIAAARLQAAIEVQGTTAYAVAKAITRSESAFRAAKEALRAILAGEVKTTSTDRLRQIARHLRVPELWLTGFGPEVPELPFGMATGGARDADTIAELPAADLAAWRLHSSWWEAFLRLPTSEPLDPADEGEMVASVAEWWFVAHAIGPLLDPSWWRARLYRDPSGIPPDGGDLAEARKHLIEAFRLILLPWTRDRALKVDIRALDALADRAS